MKKSPPAAKPTPDAALNQVVPPIGIRSEQRGSQAGTGLDGDRKKTSHASAGSEMDRNAGGEGDPAARK